MRLLVMGAMAALPLLATQAAEDLTVAEGDALTISENATYGTMKIYGSLTIAPGVTVTVDHVVYDLNALSDAEGAVHLKEGSLLTTTNAWAMSGSGTFHVYFEGGTASFPQMLRYDNGTNIFEGVDNPIRIHTTGKRSPIFSFGDNRPRIYFTGNGGFVRTGVNDNSQLVNNYLYNKVIVMNYTGATTLQSGRWNLQGCNFPYSTDLTIMSDASLGLNGNSGISYTSVNGDGYINDANANKAYVSVTGDRDSDMRQLDTIGTYLTKSGAGTLTLAPRNAMSKLTINGGKVILQSRAEAGYRNYRFKVDEGRGPGSSWNATQMGELYWYDADGNDVSQERTSPRNAGFSDGWADCLFDRTKKTKWYSGVKYDSTAAQKDACYVDTSFPGLRRIRSYLWGTAWDVAARDPSAWRIQAWISGGTVTLAAVTNFAANTTRDADAASTNFVLALPSTVTIPIVSLATGTSLTLDGDTTLATTNLTGSILCNLALTNGGTFAWEPQADQTMALVNLSGDGTFVKNGARIVTFYGANTLTGTLHVAGGTLKMRGVRHETRRLFRFAFEKNRWMALNPGETPTDSNNRTLQFGEVALYNERGERVSLRDNFSYFYGTDNGGNLYDNNPATSCYRADLFSGTYVTDFTLKEGVAEYVTGYRFSTESQYWVWGGKSPGTWKVYARATSSDPWELIDQQDCSVASGNNGYNSWNGGIPFMFTNATDTVAAIPSDCRVQVDGGATLDVAGTATTFANLALDCSAETDATLVGGSLAADGTLALENVPAVGSTYFLPLAFNGTEGLANARNWSFTIDGAPAPKLRLTALGGRLALCTTGTMLILR